MGGATGSASFTSDAQAESFADTVWNLFLGAIASDRHSAYLVRNTFRNNFGRNPIWWLTGLAALAAVLAVAVARVDAATPSPPP